MGRGLELSSFYILPARVSAREYVEPEHLLLGLMREDKALSAKFIGTFTAVESKLCEV
jgi:hypothetical protein